MSFERGFALGDSDGADVFLQGANLGDALAEAERIYPRHTPVLFDGDLFTAEREDGNEFSPNLAPSKMPALAHKQSGLGTYTADEVLSMSVTEAHAKIRPFFRRHATGRRLGDLIPAYGTPHGMMKKFLTANAKLMKAARGAKGGVKAGLSRGPNLMPHRLAIDLSRRKLPMEGLGFCVGSNEACRATCLVYSGKNPLADRQSPAKLSRSESLVLEPVAWLRIFCEAIQWHVDWCTKPATRTPGEINGLFGPDAEKVGRKKLVPYLRPNLLSDIPWELVFPDLFELFPKLQFYDYTKVAGRRDAANYDLTFSFSGSNTKLVRSELRRRRRVAVVFWLERPCGVRIKPPCDDLEELTFLGRPVLNGDAHDFRSLDPPGSVIGLTYKVPTREEEEGRVRYPRPPAVASKFVVDTVRDTDTGALIVAGTPAQLGADMVFERAAPTELAET
jgi:hypothetical protein